MKIRISRLRIKNFRGIRNADISFSNTNFLVGNNGTGKTSCLAVIARLMPILRGEERIFLDGDFLFEDSERAESIELTYYFDLIFDDQTQKSVELQVEGTRSENGKMRSHLNDQQTGGFSTSFSDESDIIPHIKMLNQEGAFTQRIIRNGWGGGRICPISLQTDQRQKHAATSTQEESGAFDGLRARLVQKLRDTELGKIVDEDHPDLLSKVLGFTNQFLDELRFTDIQIGYSDMLSLVRQDGTVHSWDGLSGGEQSAFNLAMAIEFSRAAKSLFLIIEEPETNLHPSVQRNFLKIIENHLPNRQIFVSTHSPYIFENYLNSSNLIIGKKSETGTILENPSHQQWLFSSVSWGELSFHAYNLPTFEYHNELYGWIQERTGNWSENQMERFFVNQGCIQDKQWTRSRNGQLSTDDRTAMTFIRNFTHHPENTHNNMYTENELHSSISKMLTIVQAIR
jgi:ABC-type cobalamin/Fe3+-siderophores transport system ATPase subunit